MPPSYLKTEYAPSPLTPKHDLLVAAGVALARREQLRLEAAALRIARQHPQHVARPDGGLVTADALADLEDHVLLVGRVGLDQRELELLLELGEALLRIGDESFNSGSALDASTSSRVVRHSCASLYGDLELLQPPPHLGRLAVIVVDGRVGHPRLQVRVGALELVDQVFDRRRHAT